MKKHILGALLVGTFSSHGAVAEMRSFSFTANVSSLASPSNPAATSLDGILAGTTVALGDVIKGSFSFDDAGVTWGGANFTGFRDTIAFRYEFTSGVASNGSAVDPGPARWAYTPNFIGTSDLFNIVATSSTPHVASNLTLFSPHAAFAWELGGLTYSTLAVTWVGADSTARSLNANLSSLVEVTPVPEPSTAAMLLLGAAVVTGVARRRRS